MTTLVVCGMPKQTFAGAQDDGLCSVDEHRPGRRLLRRPWCLRTPVPSLQATRISGVSVYT